MSNNNYISYSELKDWVTCPFYHKLVHLDNLKSFKGNEYTAFGKAIHHVCEVHLLEESIDVKMGEFKKVLTEEANSVGVLLTEQSFDSMCSQANNIFKDVLPAMREYLNDDFEVIATEEPLMEPINHDELKDVVPHNFKGYIDLVLKTKSDQKYHILDWKTCTFGWLRDKKQDPNTVYQLTLYKHFYGQKHNIPAKQIETHFGLLKRTVKKDYVELFRVSNAAKRTNDALNLVVRAIKNMESGNFMKNKLSCPKCEFKKSVHCP